MRVEDEQVVRIISEHGRKLERLETLGTPAGGSGHHTLCAFTPAVAVSTFGRIRLLPGAGKLYRVISWAIMLDVSGSVVVDLLKSSGYPPVTTMCGANRPSCIGHKSWTGTPSGWSSTTFQHGDYLILNIFSYAVASQLGFSMELAPEVV